MSDVDEKNNLISWVELGDMESCRPNLGELVPVSVYRSLQYSIRQVLAEEFGSDFADTTLFKAGRLAGEKFCRDFLDVGLSLSQFLTELKRVLLEHKIGVLRIEKADLEKMEFLLTVAEDLDCSGLPIIGKTACNYDEGFLAGIMKVYMGKEFSVKEIDCWGIGGRVCRFLVNRPE